MRLSPVLTGLGIAAVFVVGSFSSPVHASPDPFLVARTGPRRNWARSI